MLTATEARMRAAQIALEAVHEFSAAYMTDQGQGGGDDRAAVSAELRKIEDWLRRESVGNDKILLRQLARETGRQVKPTAAQAKALGRIVKGRKQ